MGFIFHNLCYKDSVLLNDRIISYKVKTDKVINVNPFCSY